MSIAVTDTGEGPALVLIHGIATNRAIWDLVQPGLSEGRRVVAVDIPGFGESDPVGDGFDLEEIAGAIVDGIGQVGVPEPFDVLGQSLGGGLALVMAAHYAGSVDRLLLGAPAGFGAWSRGVADLAAAGSTGLIAGRRVLGDAVADSAMGRRLLFAGAVVDAGRLSPERARTMIAASASAVRTREALAAILAADLRPELRAIRAPLGLIWGTRDITVPPRLAEEIREIRPGTPLETISSAAHIPQIEAPLAYTDAVERLLRLLPSEPARAR